ncbi:MAG: ABC transporter permease [Halobacteriovoraceae bacterium]|nr:ABC transporter permease [Halobacteriovoraceae bacterium]MCB9094169.1 ABC transporter permease [Halobacteriovoraceae bacterium]
MELITNKVRNSLELIGNSVIEFLDGLGKFTIYFFRLIAWSFRPPYRTKLFFQQVYFIGNKSLFIVALTSTFSGMVMAYQSYLGFSVMNAHTLVGPIVAIGLAKELGPVFSALIVTGRCGAAMAAEIGTMKVTEQIDALEVMGISSIQYLGVPRLWAATISLPMLSMIFLLVGNIGSYMVGVHLLSIEEVKYFAKLRDFMEMSDIYEGLIKAGGFGFMIGLIGTYHGFQVKGGAEGVGKGTNAAVVWGMITVLIADFFLTSILVKLLE